MNALVLRVKMVERVKIMWLDTNATALLDIQMSIASSVSTLISVDMNFLGSRDRNRGNMLLLKITGIPKVGI